MYQIELPTELFIQIQNIGKRNIKWTDINVITVKSASDSWEIS